ncbi:MAG: restriction endonuclease subunit S [bacterium]|nr:restriction endonuclease subunit S [Acidimicrobiia bacterium]MCY4368689.1 restriction endonuclease subunit S [bacterium]
MRPESRLKRQARIIAGQSLPSSQVGDLDEHVLPFLQGNAEFTTNSPVPVHACDSAPKRARAGDILLSVRAPVGALNIADQPYGIGRGLCAIRSTRADQRFLWWALHHSTADLQSRATGSTYEAVSVEDVADTLIPIPPLTEQRAIADYLDTETSHIDTLITKKRRMIELLEERWIAVVSDATTASGRNGSRIALRRMVESTIGGAWGKDPGQGDLDTLCVRGTDFDTAFLRVDKDRAPARGFTYEEFQRRRLVDGDLVIEKSGGGDKQPVGRVVQWSGDDAGVPTNFAARLRPAAGVDSRFLAFLLRASYEIGVTRRWIKQTTGIQNLDLGGFLSEKYALPPPREQSSIAKQLDEATRHRSLMQGKLYTQIGLLAERRRALITAAVTGELSVA